MSSELAALHLLRLVSPSLPVGAFSYSRGLEAAVEVGLVHDEHTAADFLLGTLAAVVAPLDGAVVARIHRALVAGDGLSVARWTRFLSASRESRELQLEDEHMGRALYRLLRELDGLPRAPGDWAFLARAGFATLFAVAAHHHGVSERDSVRGYLWALADNQTTCAVRLIPLGQTAGQRLLCRAIEALPALVERALSMSDPEVGGFSPGLALLSAQHETQYCRLFRS